MGENDNFFTDTRDGKTYKTVKIGDLILMAENLAYEPGIGNYWIYKNDRKNLTQHGYLYDWETAKQVPPEGWHLPTKEEWKALCQFICNNYFDENYRETDVHTSSLNIILSGYRDSMGNFSNLGQSAYFWSDTYNVGELSYNLYINEECLLVDMDSNRKKCAFSVRCIKNS